MDISGNKYMMFRLTNRKYHPEIGATTSNLLFGIGYDINKSYSIDIYSKKKFNLKGKPSWGVGISKRF